MSLLEKVDGIMEGIGKINSKSDTILRWMEEINGKLDRLLAKGTTIGTINVDTAENDPNIEPIIVTTEKDYMLPKTGEYQWYKLKGDDKAKLRKCSNEGCNMFLKYNGDKKKYEHWKYDANTGVGGYVQDTCDHYFLEGL